MNKNTVPSTQCALSGGLRLFPLSPTPKNKTLFMMIEKAAGAVGCSVFENYSKGAAESGSMLTILDIPTLCSMGQEGAELHAPEEYMLVPSFLPRCEMIALTALQAASAFENRACRAKKCDVVKIYAMHSSCY